MIAKGPTSMWKSDFGTRYYSNVTDGDVDEMDKSYLMAKKT